MCDAVVGRRRCDDAAATAVRTTSSDVQPPAPTLAEVDAATGRDALSRAAAEQYVEFARSSADTCFDYSYPQLDAVTSLSLIHI